MLSTFFAVVATLVDPSAARTVPYTLRNGTKPTFEVDFWSGIACSGVHTGNFSGPQKNYTGSLDPYSICEPIPYVGVTGAVTFRGDGGYFFVLHTDLQCVEGENAAGGLQNDTRVCLHAGTAVAWSVAMIRDRSTGLGGY